MTCVGARSGAGATCPMPTRMPRTPPPPPPAPAPPPKMSPTSDGPAAPAASSVNTPGQSQPNHAGHVASCKLTGKSRILNNVDDVASKSSSPSHIVQIIMLATSHRASKLSLRL